MKLKPQKIKNVLATFQFIKNVKSVCIECGVSIVTDTDTTSQENFIDHVSQDHQREATCHYYSFHGVHLFEVRFFFSDSSRNLKNQMVSHKRISNLARLLESLF